MQSAGLGVISGEGQPECEEIELDALPHDNEKINTPLASDEEE
jgi:hypothetical protein